MQLHSLNGAAPVCNSALLISTLCRPNKDIINRKTKIKDLEEAQSKICPS